jgi:hypothetical protein
MSPSTDSEHTFRRILPHLAFWTLVTFLIMLPLLATTLACWAPPSSDVPVDFVVCSSVTGASAVFFLVISTFYATLTFGDTAEACLLFNLAGILLGLLVNSHRE